MNSLKKAVAVFTCFVTSAVAVVDTTLPSVKVEDAKVTIANKKQSKILKWFDLMPALEDFDANKDGDLNQLEYYEYMKKMRVQFVNSPFIVAADTNENGYASEDEWDKQVAIYRTNGEWVEVFDANDDKKLSVDEELNAVSHMKRIRARYNNNVQLCAMTWTETLNVDKVQQEYDTDGNYEFNADEVANFLDKTRTAFMFYMDWNNDGKFSKQEAAAASETVNKLFTEVNRYLALKKKQKFNPAMGWM